MGYSYKGQDCSSHTRSQACDKSVLEAIMRYSPTTPTKFNNAVAKCQNRDDLPSRAGWQGLRTVSYTVTTQECRRKSRPAYRRCAPVTSWLVSCNTTSVVSLQVFGIHPPQELYTRPITAWNDTGHTVSCPASATTSSWLKNIYAVS